MPTKSRSARAGELLAAGFTYDDGPHDEVGECTDEHGCIRTGRWAPPPHSGVWGSWCTQHALVALGTVRRGRA